MLKSNNALNVLKNFLYLMEKNVLNALRITFTINKNYNVKSVLKIEYMTKLKKNVFALQKKSFGLEKIVFHAIILNILIVKKWIVFFVPISKCMM